MTNTAALETIRWLRTIATDTSLPPEYISAITSAADQLEELDERVAIMSETEVIHE